MAQVTVSSGNGSTVTVSIGSLQNAQIAAQALAGVSQGVNNGTITPFFYGGSGPLVPPAGPSVMFLTGPGGVPIPNSTGTVVDTSSKPDTLFGGTSSEQLVVSDKAGITYFANTGAGTVIAGGGANTVFVMPGSGDHLILTDRGDDNIFALSGNDTVSAGKGNNKIVLGTGNDSVQVTGRDTIGAGGGSDTITVVTGHAVVTGGLGDLLFANAGEASTVFGGAGSETISGGAGGGEFHGGAAGDNFLFGGAGATTLFGGGDGDQLFGVSAAGDLLVAGPGNETLTGLGGNDTFRAGSGDETMTAVPGGNDYDFIKGQAGGAVTISAFAQGDELTLEGYKSDALANALKHATVSGGSTVIELPDNTSITFLGVTDLGGILGDGKGGGPAHNDARGGHDQDRGQDDHNRDRFDHDQHS